MLNLSFFHNLVLFYILLFFTQFKLKITAGSAKCTPCPAGYYCPSAIDAPKICPIGTYSSIAYTECFKSGYGSFVNTTGAKLVFTCPPGYYCPHIINTTPTKCPKGTYSQGNAYKCLKCKAGFYAENEGSSICLECPSGSYCCNPALKHTQCAKGTVALLKASTECNNCIPGQYADKLGSTQCSWCPANKYCCNPADSPIACPSGSFSLGMLGFCTKCMINMPFFSCVACPTCPQPPACTFQPKIVEKCASDSIVHDSNYLATVGDCNFYMELEASKKCGPTGYLQGYGFKYCSRFGDHYNSFNADVNICF